MAGTLRLSNTGTGNGQSTITTAASGDTTYTLPSGGGTFVTTSSTQALTVPFASGTASAPSVTFLGDSNTGIYSPGADQVAVATNGTGRLFIDASGNVGVGTSSVNALLEVNNSTAGGEVQRIEGNYDGSGSVTLTNWRRAGGSVAAALKYNDDSSPLCMSIGTTTSHEFRIRTADTDAITIDASQRVGIGTSSPQASARLHVYATGNYIDESAPFTVGDSTAGGMRLFFGINNTSNYGYIGSVESATAYRSLVLQPGGGNVGIGTTSPGAELDVRGGANVGDGTTTVRTVASGGVGFVGTSTNHPLSFRINNGEAARIDSSGRLLVGTSSFSGSARAVFQGNNFSSGQPSIVYFQRDSSSSGLTAGAPITYLLFADNTGGIYGQIACEVDGAAGTSDYPGRLTFSTTSDGASSPTERLRITSAGNVGIGTTSPVAKLTVVSTSSVNGVNNCTLRSSDNATSSFYIGHGPSSVVNIASDNNIGFGYTNNTTYTERMRLDTSGRLLVGTSTAPGNGELLRVRQASTGTEGAGINLSGEYSLADDASQTITLPHAAMLMVTNQTTGQGGLLFATYNSAVITIVSDPSSIFATSDTDAKLCVFKSANTNAVTVKNRLGATHSIGIGKITIL
jgi:hypothetical protein